MGVAGTARGNEGLLLLAALASIQLARGLSSEQIELLAAFFEVLGDNLALLIATPAADSADGSLAAGASCEAVRRGTQTSAR